MGSIDGYIVRTTFGAFFMVLISLTGVIWITQALRGIDLMTSQGQTIMVFLGLTGLAIPSLVLIITPLALMIAVTYVLNKLATDSEIIVMNAAGVPPWFLFRPFLIVTTLVSLMVLALGFYLAPEGLRRVSRWNVEITGDVVTNILHTGQFMSLEPFLTIFARERQPGGRLSGIFIDDRRNPKERVSIIADRGVVVKNATGAFLVLEDGNLQRFEAGRSDPVLVKFERDAFDMSKFGNGLQTAVYSARERYFWELIAPDPQDPGYFRNPGQFRAEFHDRISALIYPFVFVAVTFAFLGAPRTTRQSRAVSIAGAILVVAAVRIAGFACSVVTAHNIAAPYIQYALLAAALLISWYVTRNVIVLEVPARLTELLTRWTDRFARPAPT